MLLFELFTTVYPYAIEKNDDKEWVAKFWDPKAMVPVRFAAMRRIEQDNYHPDFVDYHAWKVGFTRGREISNTGQGNAYKILSTVVELMKKFLQEKQPNIVVFSAEEPSKAAVYQSLINKMASELGYVLRPNTGTGIFVLEKRA